MDLCELPVISPPLLVCPKGFKPLILGDFEKSGSPRVGGWGANSSRNLATPKTLSVDLTRWLLGEAISTTELNPLNPQPLMSRS